MNHSDNSNSRNAKPTKIRYRMIVLAMLVAVLLYLDRICMSTAGQSVAADLKISDQQLNMILGAFFWTYALGQLPAGLLGDRYGARWMLGVYIILWSLCTGLMGFANSIIAVVSLRLGCGLFEAGAYPVAASIVRRWVPMERRGIASSLVAVGGRLGGAIAPILTIQLMLWWTLGNQWWGAPDDAVAAVTSWRPVMMLYGLAGIFIAFIFMALFRNWPDEHPLVNTAEAELIRGHEQTATLRNIEPNAPPILAMIFSFSLWMNCFVQFAANFGWAFLVTKMPKYLEDVHHSTQQAQGWLQSLPLLAGILGLLLGGWMTDSLTRIYGRRWGRSVAMSASRIIVALAFLGCLIVDNSIEAVICLAIVGLATDLGTPACWAYGQDVGGNHVGSVVGWSNMWGNFGAALSPMILGGIVGSFSELSTGWHVAFLSCVVVNFLAAIAAMGVSSAHPLCPNE